MSSNVPVICIDSISLSKLSQFTLRKRFVVDQIRFSAICLDKSLFSIKLSGKMDQPRHAYRIF